MSQLNSRAQVMVGVIGPGRRRQVHVAGAHLGRSHHSERKGHRIRPKRRQQRRTSRDIRGRIAYMPQGLGRNLYPTLSVFENIDFFGRLFGQSASERRARITELLTATALDPFEDRPAGKLSGGMKQKLSLCCALINDPDLLILDEPTTGVDPLSRGQFWDLINTIRARRPQMSVMVATAYMDEAQRFDWLMAMDDGKIIAHGTSAGNAGQDGRAYARGSFHRPDAGGKARTASKSDRAAARGRDRTRCRPSRPRG